MLGRKSTGSVVCPNCGRLVGVRDAKCYQCGRPYPGLFGFTPLLNQLGRDFSFGSLVFAGCIAMFVLTLAYDVRGIQTSGLLSFLSPSLKSTFIFGNSGYVPTFVFDRWWTVLSASWLHGGIIHIGFNLYWARMLVPAGTQAFGAGRLVILYVLSGACGFLATSAATLIPIRFLSGAGVSLGASASLAGIMGGLLYWARTSGNRAATKQLTQFALMLLAFGLLVQGVDNWAHIGGFGGGYLVAKLLKPLEDETPLHLIGALALLIATLASIVVSVWLGLEHWTVLEQMLPGR